VGITEPGGLLMIMGTSTCDIFVSTEEREVEGICGVVEDGVIPGYFGYEGGQACVGDHFKWFVENCVPAEYKEEAKARGINIQQLLTEKSEQLHIGESGLLALDWWNGNRSVLIDVDLTGMMLGLTLATKPEEIYRALIEATAFGQRVIIDDLERQCYNEHTVHLVIHYDPVVVGDEELEQIRTQVQTICQGIDSRISIHDFRMVSGTGHTNLIFDMALPFERMPERKAIRAQLEQELNKGDTTYYLVITFDAVSFNDE